MEVLYNYGISQEDVLSEYKALEIARYDSLLCIASGGEIPLNMTALGDINITAVDNSVNQLRLCRIKQVAAAFLDFHDAASFLGYMKMFPPERKRIFNRSIGSLLSEDDFLFWDKHSGAIQQGVINSGRFEQYMRKISALGRSVVGKKNLYRLFECNTIEEQREIFDRYINGLLVKSIFKTAFHPRIYKNRGIDPAGLTHSGVRNIAEFFFLRFRNFCCSTLARKNYYLQYTFFNRVLFEEALPEFLQPAYHEAFIKNLDKLEFRLSSMENVLSESAPGKFNKIHLSNIGDWMEKDEMVRLFSIIRDKTSSDARVVMRYIHYNHKIPGTLPELKADYEQGEFLALTDRYPFYTVVPIIRQ